MSVSINRLGSKPTIRRSVGGTASIAVKTGPQGPIGATGPTGPTGATGAPGGSDASFAGWVNDTASQTRAALSGAYAAVKGGTFVADKAYPNLNVDHRIVWVENSGATLYALGIDLAVYKSVDTGKTWTARANMQPTKLGYMGMFLKTAAGSLLTIEDASPLTIKRSTSASDGAAWTTVHTFAADELTLTSQSWCQDATTGHLYVGVYQTVDTFTTVKVYRSTDDGATWATWKSFEGPASASADKIRHIHAMQYDSVSQRVYITTGDTEAKCGIYRVNAAGTDVEAVLTKDMVSATVSPRAIGLMFFSTHLAWGSDEDYSTGNAAVYRMARTQIGQATPQVDRVFDLPDAVWSSVRAASDGSTWLIATGNQPSFAEDAVHLYAVSNNGATVREVGAILATGQDYSTVQPVGQAETHGASMWLGSRGFAYQRPFSLRAAIVQSSVPLLSPPRPAPLVWQTQSSGDVDLTASQTKKFGATRSPATNNRLFIYDMGARVQSGAISIRVVNANTAAVLLSTSANSFRLSGGENKDVVFDTTITANTPIEFHIVETGAATAKAAAYVTYAWGVPNDPAR